MTTILTGRSLTLTLDAIAYTAQCSGVSIVPTNNTETYQTLAGPTSARISESFELSVKGWQDWNAAGSMSAALWAAAVTNTPIPFEMKVDGDGTWAGEVVPVFPTAGGDAGSALEMDLTFPIVGIPTFTP